MAGKNPDPMDKHVGARLKIRRLMLKMSQEKLGERLGVSSQQVKKYENGTNRMGSSRLQQLAAVLQIPVTFFFENAPGELNTAKTHSPTYLFDFVASPDGLALIRAFMRLKNSGMRRAIVQLVEDIAAC
jgi:transcriptional regulator with XRE-family HTH domain